MFDRVPKKCTRSAAIDGYFLNESSPMKKSPSFPETAVQPRKLLAWGQRASKREDQAFAWTVVLFLIFSVTRHHETSRIRSDCCDFACFRRLYSRPWENSTASKDLCASQMPRRYTKQYGDLDTISRMRGESVCGGQWHVESILLRDP